MARLVRLAPNPQLDLARFPTTDEGCAKDECRQSSPRKGCASPQFESGGGAGLWGGVTEKALRAFT